MFPHISVLAKFNSNSKLWIPLTLLKTQTILSNYLQDCLGIFNKCIFINFPSPYCSKLHLSVQRIGSKDKVLCMHILKKLFPRLKTRVVTLGTSFIGVNPIRIDDTIRSPPGKSFPRACQNSSPSIYKWACFRISPVKISRKL